MPGNRKVSLEELGEVEELEKLLEGESGGEEEAKTGEKIERVVGGERRGFLEEVFERARKVDSIVFLKRGQTIKCRVVDIRGDIYGNIFPKPSDPERLKIWEKKFNRFVWLIMVECPEHGIKFIDILSLSLHPNSRYVRLKKCYNVIKVGSEVFVGEEQGRIKIVCPEE